MCQPQGNDLKCTCGMPTCAGELGGDRIIAIDELLANAPEAEFAPDMDLLDAEGKFQEDPAKRDGVKDSLSVGVGFTCVKASFTAPGEP